MAMAWVIDRRFIWGSNEFTVTVCNRTTLNIKTCLCYPYDLVGTWSYSSYDDWCDKSVSAGNDLSVSMKYIKFAKFANFTLTLYFEDRTEDEVKFDMVAAFAKRGCDKVFERRCILHNKGEHKVKISGDAKEKRLKIVISHTDKQLQEIKQKEEDKKLKQEVDVWVQPLHNGKLTVDQLMKIINQLKPFRRRAHCFELKLEIDSWIDIANDKLVNLYIKDAEEEENDGAKAMRLLEMAKLRQEIRLRNHYTYEISQKLDDINVLIKTAKEYNELARIQEIILQMENNVEKVNQMSKLISKLNDVIKQCEKKSHMSNRKVFEARLKYLTEERDDLKKTLDMLITSNQLKVVASLEKNATTSEEAVHQKAEEAQNQAEAKSQYMRHVQEMTEEEKQLELDLADLEFDVVEGIPKGMEFEWKTVYEEDRVIDEQF